MKSQWPGESLQQAMTAETLGLLADAVVSLAERKTLSTRELLFKVDELRSCVLIARADIVDELVERAGLEKSPVAPRLSALRRAAESLDPSAPLRRQPDVTDASRSAIIGVQAELVTTYCARLTASPRATCRQLGSPPASPPPIEARAAAPVRIPPCL